MAITQSCGNRSPISGECIIGCGGFGGCQRGYEDHIKPRSDMFNPLTGKPYQTSAKGKMSGYETAVLTGLANFHGYSLDEVEEKYAQFEDLTRKIMEKVQEAIEARLKRLVADGISIDRIRIEQRQDGSTAIVVDSIPDSSFRITYADDRR